MGGIPSPAPHIIFFQKLFGNTNMLLTFAQLERTDFIIRNRFSHEKYYPKLRTLVFRILASSFFSWKFQGQTSHFERFVKRFLAIVNLPFLHIDSANCRTQWTGQSLADAIVLTAHRVWLLSDWDIGLLGHFDNGICPNNPLTQCPITQAHTLTGTKLRASPSLSRHIMELRLFSVGIALGRRYIFMTFYKSRNNRN